MYAAWRANRNGRLVNTGRLRRVVTSEEYGYLWVRDDWEKLNFDTGEYHWEIGEEYCVSWLARGMSWTSWPQDQTFSKGDVRIIGKRDKVRVGDEEFTP